MHRHSSICSCCVDTRGETPLPDLSVWQTIGPFFPTRLAEPTCTDLTELRGRSARGTRITLSGRIMERESIELAYVAALQHLSPVQRATLILREVLGFSAAEVADLLDTSAASVNSALQRARKAVDSTAETQQTILGDLGDDSISELVERWANAWEAADVDTIVSMLAEDARFSMPPWPEWYHGHDAIRRFLVDGPLTTRWRFVPTTANGQLAFGTYMWKDEAGAFVPGGLDVLTIRDGRVADVTAFIEADLTQFGLPARLLA